MLCEDPRLGRCPDWRVLRTCESGRANPDFSDEVIDETYATWGFLEVEDRLASLSPFSKMDFAEAMAGHCK